MNTPSLLRRAVLLTLTVEVLLVVVVCVAVPGGASALVELGFVVTYDDRGLLSQGIIPIFYADPTVYVAFRSALGMLSIALIVGSLYAFIRTNPWQTGGMRRSAQSPAQNSDKSPDQPPAPDGPTAP